MSNTTSLPSVSIDKILKGTNLSDHPLYRKRRDMINRCTNPNVDRYHRYGGRGINVCETWLNHPHKFIEWAVENGWKEGLTIDRICVDGDYTPSNCKFSTPKEQHYNKTNSKYVVYQDNKYCFAEFVSIHFNKNYERAYKSLWYNLKKNKTNIISKEIYEKFDKRYNKEEGNFYNWKKYKKH